MTHETPWLKHGSLAITALSSGAGALCYLTGEGKLAVLIGAFASYYGLLYLTHLVLGAFQSARLMLALRLVFVLPLVLTAALAVYLGLFFEITHTY